MKPSDFLTELSNDKLTQYKTAAAADASKADKEGDFKKGDKRFSGIVKATKKQFDNDAKKDVEEGWKDVVAGGAMALGALGAGAQTMPDINVQRVELANKYYNVLVQRAKEDGIKLDTRTLNVIKAKAQDAAAKKTQQSTYQQGFSGQGSERKVAKDAGQFESQGVAEGILGSDPNRGQKVPDWAKRGIVGKIGRKLDPAWSDVQMTVPQHLLSKQSSEPTTNSLATKDMPKATSITPTRAILQRVMTKPSHPVTKNGVTTIADKQGVAEGQGSIVDKCASLAAKYFNSAGLQQQYDIDEFIKINTGDNVVVDKCASLAAKYFNSAGLQQQYDIGEYIKANVRQGVAEEKCPHCNGPMVSEELMNEKKDACYYKVKSRYKVWPSAYASGALVKCRKKGADSWGNGSKNESSILEGIERADESLHDWFNKEKWVRMDTKGNIKGPCAKEPGEGKPKCLPQAKAHSLGKKGRASAAARKRREDPNPDRSGKAINVNTKKD